MFLKITAVTGESKDKVHTNEIDISAWSWGMSNSSSAHFAGGAGSGKVSRGQGIPCLSRHLRRRALRNTLAAVLLHLRRKASAGTADAQDGDGRNPDLRRQTQRTAHSEDRHHHRLRGPRLRPGVQQLPHRGADRETSRPPSQGAARHQLHLLRGARRPRRHQRPSLAWN